MNRTAILLVFIAGIALVAQTRNSPRPKHTAAEIEPLLARIATYEYGADPNPVIQFDELVSDFLGSPEMRRTLEARLLKLLESNATAAGKETAFRQLSLIGTEASVPALARLLTNPDSAEMARYALAAIPGRAADEALRKSLAQAPADRIRIGIINSIGNRKDAGSVSALAALLPSSNPQITAAVVAALANIGSRPALDTLAAARQKAAGAVRDLVSEGYVVCADQLALHGEKAVAVNVYKEMLAASEPRMIRTRALNGLTAAEGRNAMPALLAEIRSTDPGMQTVAIRLLDGISGADVTKALITEFPKASALAQVHLLTALGRRGDSSARPTIVAALKSDIPELRAAALAGLGKLGDESSVLVLAQAAATGSGPEQAAARDSLHGLRGARIDTAIVAGIGSTSGKVKTELMLAAGERGTAPAADALAKAAQETDADVRREALRALRNVGTSAQAPVLLTLLLNSPTATDRRETTQTLAAVLKRSQPAPVGAVLSAYKTSPDKQSRLSLLEVMGLTSNPDALAVLRSSVKDPDAEIARAAILALTNWDTPAPLPDLLELAKGAARTVTPEQPDAASGQRGGGRGALPPTNNLQVLALRGVLRLMVLPSRRSAAESGRLLGEVMRYAMLAPEKRTVLSLLPSFPSRESLGVAQSALRDGTVANEAKLAFDQLNEAMKLE